MIASFTRASNNSARNSWPSGFLISTSLLFLFLPYILLLRCVDPSRRSQAEYHYHGYTVRVEWAKTLGRLEHFRNIWSFRH
jgi:hypothetical protein